jgi:class 3 adenylate cyclase
VRVTAEGDVPIDPTLAEVMAALNAAGHWAVAFDDRWRRVAVTDDLLEASYGEVPATLRHNFGPEEIELRLAGSAGGNDLKYLRWITQQQLGWMLADTPGGADAVRAALHPALRDLVDDASPSNAAAIEFETPTRAFGGKIDGATVAIRVRDATGRLVGTVSISKPAVGMQTIGMLTAAGDLDHFARMQQVATASRRPAAFLFADLEGSAQLAKRMPTAAYFTLIRRLTRAADQCVVDAGGLVGRHVGDGVTAFFVSETFGSESAAAFSCISAGRTLQGATSEVAARHGLEPDEITVRAGLHWGATLYMGSIITAGRTEVTALGDEVNEGARIEACASGGRILASKSLVERLDAGDAAALRIEPNRVSYIQLGDLDTATEKARRDAPAVPVCDLALNLNAP